jgi:hypothetical protein
MTSDIYVSGVVSGLSPSEPRQQESGDNGSECSPVKVTSIVAAITSKVSTPPYPTEVVVQPSNTGLQVFKVMRQGPDIASATGMT